MSDKQNVKLRGYIIKSTALIALFLTAVSSFAWPPELAPELNFTNQDINKAWLNQNDRMDTANPANMKYQEKFKDEVAKKCPKCVIKEMKDRYGERKFRITLKNKWYFDITLDPSVIEITSKPIRMDHIDEISKDMNSLIWDVAESVGLRIDRSGHLNFGIESTFGSDSKLFYNFLVDYLNNPGLTQGLLGYRDYANAPHPEELTRKQADALAKIFKEYDTNRGTIHSLAKRIYDDVYYKTTVFGGVSGEPHQKYQAVNITSIVNKKDTWPRLELRVIPMQKNAEHLRLLSKLFEARIQFLKTIDSKIKYEPDRFHASTLRKNIEDFYSYVTEAGLDWDEYKTLISENADYQKALTAFEVKRVADLKKSPKSKSKAINNCKTIYSELRSL